MKKKYKKIKNWLKTIPHKLNVYITESVLKKRPLTSFEELVYEKKYGGDFVELEISDSTLKELNKTKDRLEKEADEREVEIWGKTHKESWMESKQKAKK